MVVGADAVLDESSVDDVRQTEDRIVSQWGDVSADKKHQLRDRVDEILRPLGYETSLLVIRRASSLAMYFICLTLSALMSLRDQWRSRQLRDIVESLFEFLDTRRGTGRSLFTSLSGDSWTDRVKRLIWPLIDYERCLDSFVSVQGK